MTGVSGLLTGNALFSSAAAGTVLLPNGLIGGAASVKVISLREAKFQTVIRQQFDFSCGSAALATLLSFHYDYPVTEMTVFKEMYDHGDQTRIQAYGFSLLDMKRYLERHGFQSDGYRVNLDRLRQASLPAIALINTNGYKHFVLIKGVIGDEVVIGDPALGVRVMPADNFTKMWNGIAFILRSDQTTGQQHFNLAADWGVRKRASLALAMKQQSLADFSLQLIHVSNGF
ncbi:C39 family peptidase [Govanella unica]|uniref:C39 family peptidase n=1 Tax=Govanella unica TaxID=2975056 RepID=A0A9X3TZQ9_9PROT|nr:C39 family peptidase [Govania unica]MDA5194740.1 C39 family peptidase [Govania unica]